MRAVRRNKKRPGSGLRHQLSVTRWPLITKNTKTGTRPRMHWLPVSQMNGSLASLPSAIRKECENTTDNAAIRRSASKLLRRWRGSAPGLGMDVLIGTGSAARRRHLTTDEPSKLSANPGRCHRAAPRPAQSRPAKPGACLGSRRRPSLARCRPCLARPLRDEPVRAALSGPAARAAAAARDAARRAAQLSRGLRRQMLRVPVVHGADAAATAIRLQQPRYRGAGLYRQARQLRAQDAADAACASPARRRWPLYQ